MTIISHYALLGLQSNASSQEIKSAFIRLSKIWHPDKCDHWIISKTDKDDVSEIFKRIKVAYDTLTSPQERQRYDAMFERIPATIAEELFKRKWERLNQLYAAYEQRVSSPGHYIAFLRSQINDMQERQKETSHQLKLFDGHVSQLDRMLQDEAQKSTEQTTKIRTLEATQEGLLRENNELKLQLNQLQQAQTKASAPMQRASASVSQIGSFAAPTPHKLSADGLTAVVKLAENIPPYYSLEWYHVRLKFTDKDKAAAFKKKYSSAAQNSWSLQILFSASDESELSVNLLNSDAYFETIGCSEKQGMLLMRELGKYIDITNTPQYFWNPETKIKIPDTELPEEFRNKFLRFGGSESSAHKMTP